MIARRWYRSTASSLTLAAILAFAGCSSDDSAAKGGDSKITMQKPGVTTAKEGEFQVEYYDVDGDNNPDVIKYIKETADPNNPDVTQRKLHKKKVDVDGNGKVDIIKFYNDAGLPKKEKSDTDLDGTYDIVAHMKSGKLARKEILDEKGERVKTTRYYKGENLSRVEKDTNGDGKPDHFEYYEEGVLQRVGYDKNGDSEIDKWVHRE